MYIYCLKVQQQIDGIYVHVYCTCESFSARRFPVSGCWQNEIMAYLVDKSNPLSFGVSPHSLSFFPLSPPRFSRLTRNIVDSRDVLAGVERKNMSKLLYFKRSYILRIHFILCNRGLLYLFPEQNYLMMTKVLYKSLVTPFFSRKKNFILMIFRSRPLLLCCI